MTRHLLLLVALLVLVAGCSSSRRATPRASLFGNAGTVRAIDPPIVYDVAGPVAVDVETFNGDVFVRVDEQVTQATIKFTAEGQHGWDRKGEARASLEEILWTSELVPGDLGMTLRIRATTPHPEPYFQRASFEIRLPAVHGLRVRTGHGRVVARGIEGPCDIQNRVGMVLVATNRPMVDPVNIVVEREGDVFYRVRGESRGTFTTATSIGETQSRVQQGQFVVLGGTSTSHLHAQLNDGTNPVHLETLRGDVAISVIHNPEQYGTYILD